MGFPAEKIITDFNPHTLTDPIKKKIDFVLKNFSGLKRNNDKSHKPVTFNYLIDKKYPKKELFDKLNSFYYELKHELEQIYLPWENFIKAINYFRNSKEKKTIYSIYVSVDQEINTQKLIENLLRKVNLKKDVPRITDEKRSKKRVEDISPKVFKLINKYFGNRDLIAKTNASGQFLILNASAKKNIGEFRLYLDVKQNYCIEFMENISLKIIKKVDSFTEVKATTIGGKNREDSIVIYFTDRLTKNELKIVLESINEIYDEYLKKGLKDLFETYDLFIPWGSRIFIKGQRRPIGLISHHPLRSSREDLMIYYNKTSKKGSTTHDVLNTIIEIAKELQIETKSKKKIAEIITNSKLGITWGHVSEATEFRKKLLADKLKFSDYMLECMEQIKKVIPDKYKRRPGFLEKLDQKFNILSTKFN
ncbi:hypothetical protein HOK51_06725 [Candidatus Woesearchaeota archaeon]|jgi:hypothetical protein|nr:hypothetical protein [Candidatus Woesearchaeota archaeon]MBT6519517.1 hypothetical protein [Candidatus Woesearchaeota archaeon]MBT7367406.1 hypothetical protein [Candidatus Woesearchaeota archaeon]